MTTDDMSSAHFAPEHVRGSGVLYIAHSATHGAIKIGYASRYRLSRRMEELYEFGWLKQHTFPFEYPRIAWRVEQTTLMIFDRVLGAPPLLSEEQLKVGWSETFAEQYKSKVIEIVSAYGKTPSSEWALVDETYGVTAPGANWRNQ